MKTKDLGQGSTEGSGPVFQSLSRSVFQPFCPGREPRPQASTYYFTSLGRADWGGADVQNIGNVGVMGSENKLLDRCIVEVEVRKNFPEMGKMVVGQ